MYVRSGWGIGGFGLFRHAYAARSCAWLCDKRATVGNRVLRNDRPERDERRAMSCGHYCFKYETKEEIRCGIKQTGGANMWDWRSFGR
jgi:hypothetical protein